ncbi:MAG: phosphate ABC transporter substrate-binding protein [Deltaproteobacteria bacterium]|nr:phosphate ABC transporter substrate-binding protein [Deltaproteobacteria bacterium]
MPAAKRSGGPGFRRKAAGWGAALALLWGLGAALPGWAGPASLSITGSTSLLPLLQRAAEQYQHLHPEVRISVAGRGSGDGARSIIDCTADLAACSREIKPTEEKLAQQKGVTPVKHLVARGAVVPVVDPANPVNGLTLEQLRDIFAGRTRNWQDVGGRDQPITVISRDSNSGTFEIFRGIVLGKERMRPDALLMASNGTMSQAVSGNPLALGYLSIAYLNPKVKALTVNGVAASLATVQNHTYPLSRSLYILTAGPARGVLKDFIDFLQGPLGRRIALEEGYVPLE